MSLSHLGLGLTHAFIKKFPQSRSVSHVLKGFANFFVLNIGFQLMGFQEFSSLSPWTSPSSPLLE